MWKIKRFINRISRKVSRWYWYQPYWLKWCILILLYLLGGYMILNAFVGWIGASAYVWMAKYLLGKSIPNWMGTYITILSILSFVLGIITIGIAKGIHKRI